MRITLKRLIYAANRIILCVLKHVEHVIASLRCQKLGSICFKCTVRSSLRVTWSMASSREHTVSLSLSGTCKRDGTCHGPRCPSVLPSLSFPYPCLHRSRKEMDDDKQVRGLRRAGVVECGLSCRCVQNQPITCRVAHASILNIPKTSFHRPDCFIIVLIT